MSVEHGTTGDVGTLTRRAAIGAMALGAVGFAALGPRGSRERRDGRLVLDYWEKWTQHEGDAMQRVVDEFNKTQSRISVRYLVTSGMDQKALIAVAGGDPPDVVGLWNYNIPLYAETRAAIPLDEFGTKYDVRPERYATAFRPIVMHPDETGKNRMWAGINTGGTVCLYYNKTMFKEAGIAGPPRTMSELDEIAWKLTKRAPDGSLERAGFLHSEPGWWASLWCYYFGGSLFDAATNRARLDSAENIQAMEWARDWSGKLGVAEARRLKSGFANDYASSKNAFLDGKVAMIIQGPWIANVIGRHRPDLDYGVAAPPVADHLYDEKQPLGLVESDVILIPRGCRDPEASMEFLAYTQRQDVAEFLARAHFKNSPMADVSDAFMQGHPNRGVAVHNAIAASPRGFLCPRTRNWPEMKDELDAAFQRFWGHEADVRTELPVLQARIQASLDRTDEKRRLRRGGAGA
jgi:multiple sugar transport system substrate-binding protein